MFKIKIYISFILVFSLNFCFAQKTGQEKSGDILQIALPVIAATSTFFYKDGQKGGLQFAKAMVVSIVVTHALKTIINKKRPNGGNYAFPSGHTSAAFTGAAFIEKRYGFKIGIPAYLLASYVGVTRVNAKKHDYWDVLAGAIVGIGSSYLFTKPYKKNKLSLSLGNLNNDLVIGINYKF